jgi:predicted RNase H-like nuclease
MTVGRFLGVDLAWAEPGPGQAANETGVAVIDEAGHILDADWICGLDDTITWVSAAADGANALLFVDAPLMVTKPLWPAALREAGGQRYGSRKVSANSTNTSSVRLSGVRMRERLETLGWTYSDGRNGPPARGWVMSECYPYTTLVGAPELGYAVRPAYKRKPRATPIARWRTERARTCDHLIGQLGKLADADPTLRLCSHPRTRELATKPSPADDRAHKHREDLIDALICAWTAALWARHWLARRQILGLANSFESTPDRNHHSRPNVGRSVSSRRLWSLRLRTRSLARSSAQRGCRSCGRRRLLRLRRLGPDGFPEHVVPVALLRNPAGIQEVCSRVGPGPGVPVPSLPERCPDRVSSAAEPPPDARDPRARFAEQQVRVHRTSSSLRALARPRMSHNGGKVPPVTSGRCPVWRQLQALARLNQTRCDPARQPVPWVCLSQAPASSGSSLLREA